MFTLPGTIALIFFIYIRPQEVLPGLARFPFLYAFCAAAFLGLFLDLRLGHIKPLLTPQLPWVLLFWLWSIVTAAANAPDRVIDVGIDLTIVVVVYVCLSQGIQSFRALETMASFLLVLALAVAVVAIHQHHQPFGCVLVDAAASDDLTVGTPDGRACVTATDCESLPGADPGALYLCERIGWLGTTTVGGRVRYRGVLQDPNEVAMLLGSSLAFAFVLVDRKRTLLRRFVRSLAAGLVVYAIVITRSRGGLLVLMTVCAGFLVRRLGLRAVVPVVLLAPLAMLFGGRSGAEAVASGDMRLEAWREGLNMLRHSPVFGVGLAQFTEYHFLTAHNSWVLAFAELGLPGYLLWCTILYLSVKIPLVGAWRYGRCPEAKAAADWGSGITAALLGVTAGIFFLSLTYHYVLWIFMGISGAYYLAVRSHDETFRVRLGLWELLGVAGSACAFIVLLHVALLYRGM